MAGGRKPTWAQKLLVWVTSAVGAGLLAMAGGIGSGIFDKYGKDIVPNLPWSDQAEATTKTSLTGSVGGGKSLPSLTDVRPIEPADSVSTDIVRDRIPLSVDAIGLGADQAAACTSAIDTLAHKATRQCDKIVFEAKASSSKVDLASRECRSCGVFGGQWRCVAASAATCVVMAGSSE